MEEFQADVPTHSLQTPVWLRGFSDAIGRYQLPCLLASLGLQLTILLVMIASQLISIANSQSVLLRVIPVDPRDLFRGEYVILGYDFSRLPDELTDELTEAVLSGNPIADTIYVTLEPEPDSRHYRARHYGFTKPDEGLFIRGRIKTPFMIEYGIESFFVQEGRGMEYEQAIREKSLSAEVLIDASGHAMLKGLVVE